MKKIANAVGVKEKSTNLVRRFHYRLGFDCSGSAATGATRYTLYSDFFGYWCKILREDESIYAYKCVCVCVRYSL